MAVAGSGRAEDRVLRNAGLSASHSVHVVEGANFRERYDKHVRELKGRHGPLPAEFSDDDLNEQLPEEDRKRGWHYPMTKTQQKHEYGCVVAEQQRFLWRLQDGHLDIVEDYLLNEKKKKAIDVNMYDEQGWTPLHYACQRNYSEIVRVLLEGNADPLLRDKVCGLTPLDIAKLGVTDNSGPNEEVMEALSEFGVK
eukprot:CAMPEP_0203901330 /NCGR_PEP_ID=MMETSP0359-20131031/43507_1 /ASSEMBLY_ACC=CAM_ASM_000338 /TAXON_ID=268821 /ORGANISM="Scrippsiella Hangoei, Strain SHTV-5" /LENGTH=195 /DNA_ID=CAMNT_0050824967 /DNA_START=36 /DNA_END=623 /DNA_ORIENTATION=-